MLKRITNQLQLIMLLVISIILLSILVLTGFAAVKNEPSAALTESVSNFVKETLQDKFKEFRWKITEMNTMVNYKELTDSQFEAEVLVNLKHTLNVVQPEELPVLKGKLRFLKENGGNLSKKETDFLNKDVEKWRDILKRYITEPQDASIIIIAKGEIDQKDTLNPKNVSLYALDHLNNPVPLNEYLIPPKDADIEKDAYDSITFLADVIPLEPPVPRYSHSDATYYIRAYTSEASKPCVSGSSTTQDSSYYNPAYSWYQCNDCANYVSQALYFGGIPMNSTWRPYTYAWINVDGLKNFMVNSYYWASASRSTCLPGDLLTWGSDHVAMCSYNQGGVFKYCAHTSDRKDYIYSGSTATYWRVIY